MRRALLSMYFFSAVLLQMSVALAEPSEGSQDPLPPLKPIVTTFEVYVGGIHFLTADVLFEEDSKTYQTKLHAHTAGYLYKILKWDGNIASHGNIKGSTLQPIAYSNLDTWQNKPKLTKLAFNKEGHIKAEFDPPNTDQGREIVTDEQKQGALDPVTALLQMLANVAVKHSCTGVVPVFDGKRRFNLEGEDHGLELVDDKDYGIYKGVARNCSVDFAMINRHHHVGLRSARNDGWVECALGLNLRVFEHI